MTVVSSLWSVASLGILVTDYRQLTSRSGTSPLAPTAIRSYRDLIAWQRSMDLVVASYRLAGRLPKDELYGLVSQVRRAATSVPANIAEGQGRHSTRQFLHFLGIANGSLLELETHILTAQRLDMVRENDGAECLRLSAEVGRILAGLARGLRRRAPLATGH